MSKSVVVIIFVGVAFVGSILLAGGILIGLTFRPVNDFPTSAAAPQTQSQPAGPKIVRSSYGLDGYCLVILHEEGRWQIGDIQYHETHDGVEYLFAGPAEQEQFRQNPFRYLPVLSGNDVVLAKEHSVTKRGSREKGLTFHGRLYLFASEKTLKQFWESPQSYVIDEEIDSATSGD